VFEAVSTTGESFAKSSMLFACHCDVSAGRIWSARCAVDRALNEGADHEEEDESERDERAGTAGGPGRSVREAAPHQRAHWGGRFAIHAGALHRRTAGDCEGSPGTATRPADERRATRVAKSISAAAGSQGADSAGSAASADAGRWCG